MLRYCFLLMLHTLHDGSILRVMGAKDLIRVPVWHGNRIIDNAHVQKIKDGLGPKIQKLDYHDLLQVMVGNGFQRMI